MSVISLRTNAPGQNYQVPRLVRLESNDTIAKITAAGYLNNYIKMNSIALYSSDFVHVAASNGTQIYKPQFTNGTPQNGGSVQLVALS
jgi:hypothetical protein